MKFRITCCYLASDQTIDRFDTMMQSLYIYIYIHVSYMQICVYYLSLSRLWLNLQLVMAVEVLMKGGGASRSDCCDFKCHWLA